MDQILYRVLSFDGGGIRGLYHAKLLESLQASGLDLAQRADVVAGTSTGAIVAAALAIGKKPDVISKLYADVGQKVFPPRWWISRKTAWLRAKPSYSSAVLREALEKQLGKDTELGGCTKPRLMIPAISLNQYKLKVFDSKNESDKKRKLVDVVLASTAAPTYFLPAKVGETYYVDGGLCCNNPGFRAVAQLYDEGVELSRIYLLSISTGAVPVTKAGDEFTNLRMFRWIRPIINLAMSGSSDLAVQDGGLVGYHYRIDENFDHEIDLDDYQKAKAILPALAQGKADDAKVRTEVKRWFDEPAAAGLNFAGTWDTTYHWNDQSDSDTLAVEQCGEHVVGETVGECQWSYTLSGTVQGEVCIGEWKGTKSSLRGNFLLIRSKETETVSGQWVGTGDVSPYFGTWSWKRK
jgi:hypothetical protein